MLRHDYIGRLIQQLAEFLARVAKLVEEQRPAEAETEIQAAERALGIPVGAERLDSRSLAMLLGGGDKVVLAAMILEQRAAVAEAGGKRELAMRQRRRALELIAHAQPIELGAHAAELSRRLQ